MAMEKKRPKPADGSDPFEGLVIASHQPLHELRGRSKCEQCGASRKYFCYTCCIPVPKLQGKIPKVKLPVKVDVVKHARELDGKSTAIHAAVLAPDDVTIHTYPCIPDYDDPNEKVVLVYPGKNAVSLDELCAATPSQGVAPTTGKAEAAELSSSAPNWPFSKVVFIDCTWNQTNHIYKDERINGLRCVVLQGRRTCFWRGQDKPDFYLSTIEAIFYFFQDLLRLCNGGGVAGDDGGCYDNLLYFYSFMYELVHREVEDRENGSGDKERRRRRKEKGEIG